MADFGDPAFDKLAIDIAYEIGKLLSAIENSFTTSGMFQELQKAHEEYEEYGERMPKKNFKVLVPIKPIQRLKFRAEHAHTTITHLMQGIYELDYESLEEDEYDDSDDED